MASDKSALVAVTMYNYSAALARGAMRLWEQAMDPIIKAKAQSEWGDKWHVQCLASITKPMQDDMAAERTWDLYRLATIASKDPDLYFPASSDIHKELHK